jgi:hypothetical protein
MEETIDWRTRYAEPDVIAGGFASPFGDGSA